MRNSLVMLFCMVLIPAADAQQMVYIVRHGEKLDDSKDPPLSPAGEARAARLGQMLASSGVKVIYTTQYRRSIHLAAPIARALNIAPSVHPAGDTPGLLKRITAQGPDEVVLVVGHSNTIPAILTGLGHTGEVKIEETEFDNLFVLVPKAQGAPALVCLKY
jgi:broad specificity phosphatase PhoE